MGGDGGDLRIRRFELADEPAVLELLGATRESARSPHQPSFFGWKHWQNPFGRSPSWVAEAAGVVVGLRTFMRWEFEHDGEVVRAVRAVDTATHPEHQGRGIFTRLTLAALEELAADDVAFVFNTPNDKSLGGYLKMGWTRVAALPVLARPRTPIVVPRLLGARVPAEKWSLPTEAGRPASEVLTDDSAVAALLASASELPGLRTRRTLEFLRWRYSFEPLAYRAVLAGDSVRDGAAFFRLRRRGPLVEAAMCDIVLPASARRRQARLVREVLRQTSADVAVRIGTPGTDRLRALPGVGPTLVWRGVSDQSMPPPETWHLTLGDVEVF